MRHRNATEAQQSHETNALLTPTNDLNMENEKESILKIIIILTVCFLAGCIFGFAMEKGRVFEPQTIREQFVFTKWIMLKMFLAAMGTSALVFSVLSILPVRFFQEKMRLAVDAYQQTMNGKNIMAVVVGTFILGIGMALAGACPGMVLPQTGAWVYMAIVTLIGALLGTIVYGFMHDHIYLKIFPQSDKFTLAGRVHETLNVKFYIIAAPMGIVIIIAVILMEVFINWRSELSDHGKIGSGQTIFQDFAWPPSVCGCLIGLMQVVIVLAAEDTLGGSSSYATLVSQIFRCGFIKEKFPFFANKMNGLSNWWQVFYVFGGVVGGAVSAILSDTIGDTMGVDWYYALIGGMLLTIGARIASGCTSGHGLSGAGLLYWASFIGVPCMFAGGIATAFILKATGELERLHTW